MKTRLKIGTIVVLTKDFQEIKAGTLGRVEHTMRWRAGNLTRDGYAVWARWEGRSDGGFIAPPGEYRRATKAEARAFQTLI